MALRAMKPPAAANSLLRDALEKSAGPLGGSTRALSSAPAEELEVPVPLPVFVLTPAKILEESSPEAATRQGWAYTIFRGNQAIAGAELAQDRDSENLHFSHFSEGPFVEATVSAISRAESLSEEIHHDFEPRLLRCPALYVMAVWLHSESRDIFIPMAPSHRFFEPNRIYEPQEFYERLVEAAKESLAFAAQVNPELSA